MKFPARFVLADSAPLLEKEFRSRAASTRPLALRVNGFHPFRLHRTSFRARFAADDNPVDAGEAEKGVRETAFMVLPTAN